LRGQSSPAIPASLAVKTRPEPADGGVQFAEGEVGAVRLPERNEKGKDCRSFGWAQGIGYALLERRRLKEGM